MSNVLGLTQRNLLLFFRDPMNVFFSLLAALVVFLLYVLFLGNVQVQQIQATVPGADPDQARAFVDAWMFAGIVALSTMTTPLGAMSVFVEDAASGRFRDFLVSPLRRPQLVLGYFVSALTVGLIITLVVLVVAVVYLWLVSGLLLAPAALARIVGWVFLSTLGFTALWAFVVSFVRTNGAFAAVSTIVSTIAGFIAGAYIAVGLFPDTVREAVSALPFAQSAMLLRREFTADPVTELVGGQQQAIETIDAFFGISLSVGDWNVPVWFCAAVLAAMGVVFTALASTRIRSRLG